MLLRVAILTAVLLLLRSVTRNDLSDLSFSTWCNIGSSRIIVVALMVVIVVVMAIALLFGSERRFVGDVLEYERRRGV